MIFISFQHDLFSFSVTSFQHRKVVSEFLHKLPRTSYYFQVNEEERKTENKKKKILILSIVIAKESDNKQQGT